VSQRLYAGLALVLLLAGGCRTLGPAEEAQRPTLVDPDATEETKALYTNLRAVAQEHTLFGHQDDLAYGVQWDRRSDSLARQAGERRSDVRAITGSFPAVYGWDVGDLSQEGATENLDGVPFAKMQRWIVEGHERGGVITVSWHMNNFVSDSHSWDTTPGVSKLIRVRTTTPPFPGGNSIRSGWIASSSVAETPNTPSKSSTSRSHWSHTCTSNRTGSPTVASEGSIACACSNRCVRLAHSVRSDGRRRANTRTVSFALYSVPSSVGDSIVPRGVPAAINRRFDPRHALVQFSPVVSY